MTYRQALQFLYDLRLFGTKLGLENTLRLAELAGNPHRQLRFVHVAGTNGKGSTCAMLESIFRAAGLRTGLFTSPHLVSFRERIQVNREWIAPAEVARLTSHMQSLLREFPEGTTPTFFEVVTVMALTFFAERNCEIVVWETGMGGRLDATNIVDPLAAVITNVDLDHQKWLGETVEQVAFEKAGIIKPGRPVITGCRRAEACRVISEVARACNAPLHGVAEEEIERCTGGRAIGLQGPHQRVNAALAVATVRQLSDLRVPETAIVQGLAEVTWPGRLQAIEKADGRKFIIDGAHNPAGVKVLCEALKERRSQPARIVLGVLRDKAWPEICHALAEVSADFVLVRVGSERTADPDELASAIRTARAGARIATASSLRAAIEQAPATGETLITGSLYLVGEALEILCPELYGESERDLNELGVAGPSR